MGNRNNFTKNNVSCGLLSLFRLCSDGVHKTKSLSPNQSSTLWQNIWERARSHTMAQQRPHGASCTRRIGAVLPALYERARGLSHRAAPRAPPPVLSFSARSRRVSRHATSKQKLRAPKLRAARRTARARARRAKRRENARRARHREPARARREGACRARTAPSLSSLYSRASPPVLALRYASSQVCSAGSEPLVAAIRGVVPRREPRVCQKKPH